MDTLTLHNLTGHKHRRGKRRGRGLGSGRGTYSGRGVKGQRARSGGKKGLKRFGMKTMLQTFPKRRGFTSQKARPAVVSLTVLDAAFRENEKITPQILVERGLIKRSSRSVKILSGMLKKKLTVVGCRFSKTAEKDFLKAGGVIES